MSGVAIIGASGEARVDKGVLQAHAHKIRAGVSCIPDLILSRAGNTAAFILLDHSAVPDISVKDLDRQTTDKNPISSLCCKPGTHNISKSASKNGYENMIVAE